MKNWEYVLLNSLDDLRWCEGLYAYYDDGIKKMYDDDDDEPDFPNFQWVAEFPNFQWVASFLANEMTRVVDYGYLFEIILKKASKRLDDNDYIPPIEKQKYIGRILKKATIKALEKAEEVAKKYNIPSDIGDYHERERLINDKFYKRVKV